MPACAEVELYTKSNLACDVEPVYIIFILSPADGHMAFWFSVFHFSCPINPQSMPLRPYNADAFPYSLKHL
jgi:hypothetical protein